MEQPMYWNRPMCSSVYISFHACMAFRCLKIDYPTELAYPRGYSISIPIYPHLVKSQPMDKKFYMHKAIFRNVYN